MGAMLEARRCERLLHRSDASDDVGQRVVRTFMFSDVVGSTNLVEALGDDAWSGIRRWHDDTLRSVIESHGGHVVQTTGDGFFAASDDVAAAARGAVSDEPGRFIPPRLRNAGPP
jgi:class 3 adenylate cyclase